MYADIILINTAEPVKRKNERLEKHFINLFKSHHALIILVLNFPWSSVPPSSSLSLILIADNRPNNTSFLIENNRSKYLRRTSETFIYRFEKISCHNIHIVLRDPDYRLVRIDSRIIQGFLHISPLHFFCSPFNLLLFYIILDIMPSDKTTNLFSNFRFSCSIERSFFSLSRLD